MKNHLLGGGRSPGHRAWDLPQVCVLRGDSSHHHRRVCRARPRVDSPNAVLQVHQGIAMQTLRAILLYLWQLPQNLLGLLFLLVLRPVEEVRDTGYAKVYRSHWMSGGISLGQYAFVSMVSAMDEKAIMHEGVGHPRQSRMLGPLYLLIIGLLSLLWAWLHRYIAPDKSYYWFYTEKWADRLGGVKR